MIQDHSDHGTSKEPKNHYLVEWFHVHTFFFLHKNLFYKNAEAEICPNFKNMLRTYPRLRVGERLYFAHLF